jgi:hypothetical protein
MRKARANDLEKKAPPVNERPSGLRRAPQLVGRLPAPVLTVSASVSFDNQLTGVDIRIPEPTTLDAERLNYPSACTAIEYREEVGKLWEAIGQLSDFVRLELLSALEKNPRIDARDLAAAILQKLEEGRRRFGSDELKDACRAAAEVGEDAADEFRRVILLLGATVDSSDVLEKIREKYSKRGYPPT